MQLLNETVFSSTIPKVIEFGDKMVINGQVYKKNPYSPISFEFFNYSDNANRIYLKTLIEQDISNQCLDNRTFNSYIIDSEDSNIMYTISRLNHQRINKILVNGNNFTISNTWILGDSYTNAPGWCPNPYFQNYHVDFLTQSQLYIYLLVTGANLMDNHVTGTGSYGWGQYDARRSFIVSIKKSDLSIAGYPVSYAVTTQKYFQYLTKKNNFLYFSVFDLINKTRSIIRYNDTLQTTATIYSKTYNSYINVGRGVYLDLIYYAAQIILDSEDSTNKLKICLHSFDLETDKVSYEEYSISGTKDFNPIFTVNPNYTTNFEIQHIEDNMFVLTICGTNKSPGLSGQHKIVVLEKDVNTKTFRVRSVEKFTYDYLSMLPYIDAHTLLFTNRSNIDFYRYDSTAKAYYRAFQKSGNFLEIGLDSMNRFYTLNADYTVEVFSQLSPVQLKVDFAEEVYNYNGIDIETTAAFYAKNYLDEYLSTPVTLEIVGNAKFKENGKSTIVKTTSADGILSTDVIIYDSGNLEIRITQNA